MWRSLLLGIVSFPLSFLAFLIGWVAGDSFKTGVIVGLCVLALGFLGAITTLLLTRHLSTVDIFLPIPLAVVWSLLLTVLTGGVEGFTAPACIGSAILFSACLWMIRQGRSSNSWAIVPAIVFIYEMLPINIPGSFDDYFSFGGDAAFLLMQGIAYSVRTRAGLGSADTEKRLNS
jgi:hypothetical protein